jgi:thiol:disulfide interchange protein DsbA
MLNRRDFSVATATTAALAALSPALARAQAAFVEGTHYVRLAQPVAVSAGAKIEVIEFFWYGCPHCNSLEPLLEGWIKRLPQDVAFKRAPVAFRDEPFVAHQKIYYALEALGAVDAMHRKVFYAIHNDRQRLDKANDIAAFMGKNGVDATKFLDAFNSFGVQTKARQAKLLSEQYKIDGVPALGVAGRYWTSASLAGSQDKMLAAGDFLIQRARKP